MNEKQSENDKMEMKFSDISNKGIDFFGINKDHDSNISVGLLSKSQVNSQKNLEKNKSFQFRALFLKNCTVQMKQIGTNICQILTPLICLTLVLILKQVTNNLFSGKAYNMPIPLIFNLPTITRYFQYYSGLPFHLNTCLQWYYFDFAEGVDKETENFIGVNPGAPGLNSGLLGYTMDNYSCYYFPNSTKMKKSFVPYFERPAKGSSINDEMFREMLSLNNQPLSMHRDVPNLDVLPDGAVKFLSANNESLSYIIQINDLRVHEYHRGNGITKINFQDSSGNYGNPVLIVSDGQLSLMDLINKAYLHTIDRTRWIMSGVQYMPVQDQDKGWMMKLINIAGASLFPLSLSLLLPVFMYSIVLEKEERLLEMMKMNGLKMRNYWFVSFVFNFSLYIIMAAIFFLFGNVFLKLSFFTETDAGILIAIIFGWGISQVSLAIFFQVFISKARTSTIIGYLLSIWTIVIAVSLNIGVFPEPYSLPLVLRLYPPFGFCRMMYLLCNACSNDLCYKKIDDLPQEFSDCLISLYLVSLFFLVFGIYLHEVVPQEYGVRKHPFFIFSSCRKRRRRIENSLDTLNVEGEDEDCLNERKLVDSILNVAEYPLICKNLQKIYPSSGGRSKNTAVKNFSLALKQGEIFGLLGPNGAGKTTLLSMLTGLVPPNSGNAWVAGYEILSELSQAHLEIGVCPQFDLLWPDLTIKEHLLFYARLKGTPREKERERVDIAIKEVFLEKFADFKAKDLSGGMKRRLSVAISLVGMPGLIFLDEPTTGLDPENRRQLWDIIVSTKGKRAVLLTTHSMEEADVLCSRVGIIHEGTLRCVGPQIRIKGIYGGGYHLYINCHRENFIGHLYHSNKQIDIKLFHEKIIQFVYELIPKAVLITNFNGNIIFQFQLENSKVWNIFEKLEKNKDNLMISDWGVSQSTLEDVFMRIVK